MLWQGKNVNEALKAAHVDLNPYLAGANSRKKPVVAFRPLYLYPYSVRIINSLLKVLVLVPDSI